MNRKNLGFMRDLAENLTAKAKHEHNAHGTFNGRSVKEEAELWKTLSYQHVLCTEDGSSYFLVNSRGRRIEIIRADNADRPEHEAWAVPSLEEYQRLLGNFVRGTNTFAIIGQPFYSESLCFAFFSHTVTNEVVEILWRKEQIFENFFTVAPKPR